MPGRNSVVQVCDRSMAGMWHLCSMWHYAPCIGQQLEREGPRAAPEPDELDRSLVPVARPIQEHPMQHTSRVRLLVPIDGSVLSMHAVDYAAHVIDRGEIVLLHVAGIPPEYLEHPGGNTPEEERELEAEVSEQSRRYEADVRDEAEREIFDPARARLRSVRGKDDLAVRSVLITEASPDPALAIAAEARSDHYDAVVVGRNGHSGILGVLLGSTSMKLVQHLKSTPIWLIP